MMQSGRSTRREGFEELSAGGLAPREDTLELVNPGFEPRAVTGADEDELQVIAELVYVVGGGSMVQEQLEPRLELLRRRQEVLPRSGCYRRW